MHAFPNLELVEIYSDTPDQIIIDDVVTLAGFILEYLDDLPKEGSELVHNNCQFTVTEMDGNRISKVKMTYPFTGNGPNETHEDENKQSDL